MSRPVRQRARSARPPEPPNVRHRSRAIKKSPGDITGAKPIHANSIKHRLTKPNHPWTNGQVERMNRTLKEATVQRYHYGSHAQLKAHVHAFLMAYNFAKRLKTLRGLTPYEHICNVWTTQPNRFKLNPLHHTLGLNT
jgi:transposase InsO family protein